jgi:hypothetical protein
MLHICIIAITTALDYLIIMQKVQCRKVNHQAQSCLLKRKQVMEQDETDEEQHRPGNFMSQ